MSLNKHVILSTCLVAGLSSGTLAANNTKIKPTKHQTHRISQATSKSAICSRNNSCYNASRFQIGPYLNKDRLFDGSKLVINIPTVRESAKLLQQQYKLMQDCAKLGVPMPRFSRLVISGQLEAAFMYVNSYNAGQYTRFLFDSAELNLLLQVTSWVSAYAAIDYDPSKTTGKVFMNRGFLTLGDLTISPFFTAVGKVYLPFGRYSSAMVSAPLTREVARTRANAIELGYQQKGSNALHAEVYFYQGNVRYASDGKFDHFEYGADAGYQFDAGKVNAEVGTGVISNLADSAGIQSRLFKAPGATLRHIVKGFDLYGTLSYNKVTFIGEYVTAIGHFAVNDFAFANKGAEPSALNTEASYALRSFHCPSSIGVGYSQTSEAVALGLPKHSYRVTYNINVIHNSNLALQYSHNINYSVAEASGTGVDTGPLGKSDDQVITQFDYFF